MKEIYLLWDEAVCTVAPSTSALEKYLTYTEKSLEPDPDNPYNRKVVFKTKPLYKVIQNNKEYKVIQTMQGLWLRIKKFLEKEGYKVTVFDRRKTFPDYKLDKMFGFRFSQKELITKFLRTNCSGLLSAPTRYGKSVLIKNIIRAYPDITTVVTAPGLDLIRQLYEDIKESIPDREVKLIGATGRSKFPSEDITVCSMDSLHKCDPGKTRLILVDEAHAAVTDTRLPRLAEFTLARKIGLGATLTGRFDNRDILIEALFGPVWAERTFTEAVAEGAICHLIVFLLRITIPKGGSSNRNDAYKKWLYKNSNIATLVTRITKELLPKEHQVILFIKDEKEAEFYLDYIGKEGTIAMAKRLTKKERMALLDEMKSNSIKRCLASDIYAQGITFNHVRAMFNLCGGGNSTTTIQKPGRLAEVRPNKKCGVIFDFEFVAADNVEIKGAEQALIRESKSRKEAYLDRGYEVISVNSYTELENLYKEKCL